jgi:hypothetical protein
MTDANTRAYTVIGLALAIVFVVAFVAGRGCDAAVPIILDPGGIDAGPGEVEIAARLDGAVRSAEERLAAIERKHQEDIVAFDAQQRREYEAVRDMPPEEVAAWLNDWSVTRHKPERTP